MRISHSSPLPDSVRITVSVFAAALLLLFQTEAANAQARERPVAFDSAGRITSISPPLAARLGLAAPRWPVTGDYIDSRLYAIDVVGGGFVLVVQRQREVLERYPMDVAQRRALAQAIDSATMFAIARGGPDVAPTVVSEPVRGWFVVNQSVLGSTLFGGAAAWLADDPTGSAAAYLAVAGGTFFLAANMTQNSSVSRAQNHLSFESAWRGAAAADALVYAVTGDDDGGNTAYAAATLAGGIAGDVLGFTLAAPMTDAEAHGTAHGSTVTALLTAATFGAAGFYNDNRNSTTRLAVGATVVAGALGYPLGLRYVRTSSYRVTAGDIGTLSTAEALGFGVAATLLPENPSRVLGWGLSGAGFALGAVAGDRLLVRPFDHTESDARLLQYGTVAGALVGLIVPVIAQSGNSHLIFGTLTAGGIVGAVLTEQFIKPAEANTGLGASLIRERQLGRANGVGVHFSPESVAFATMGVKGRHSILSLTF